MQIFPIIKDYVVKVKDVPTATYPSAGFWSITVYDKLGYFPKKKG
jgi:hypothetical protein